MRCQSEAAQIYKANCVQLYHLLKNKDQDIDKKISGDDWMQIRNTSLSKLTDFLPESFCQRASELLQLPLSELIEQLISAFNLGSSTINLPFLFSFRDNVAVFTSQGDRGLEVFLEWWE